METLPSPSPLSGSPRMSTPPGKARYRSKPRHRRANSKGSHSEISAVLRGVALAPEEQQPLQAPCEGPRLPLPGREDAAANCANNLRYFGPAAALRSPCSDHPRQRISVAGSGPDLLSTTAEADSGRQGPSTGPLCPRCQMHPFPGCSHCPGTASFPGHPQLPHYSLLSTGEGSPPATPGSHAPMTAPEHEPRNEAVRQEPESPTNPSPLGLPRTLRPLRKVSSGIAPTEQLRLGEQGNGSKTFVMSEKFGCASAALIDAASLIYPHVLPGQR